MNKDIKFAINILERYLKYPMHHDAYPEDGETKYIIGNLKELNKN